MSNQASNLPDQDVNHNSKPLPSDAFVRKVLKRPHLVRIFFQLVLGPAQAAQIDWNTLQPADTALITSSLKRRSLDLLFSVKYKDQTNMNLMLVFEHKSHQPAKDKSPLLQLLKYEVSVYEALEDHRRAENTRRRKAKLPAIDEPIGSITSVLFYHGQRPWNVPDWQQWTGRDQMPKAKQPKGIRAYDYELCDLSKMTDQEIVTFFGQSADLLIMALFTHYSYLKKLDPTRVDYLLNLAYNSTSAKEGFDILDELSASIAEMVEPQDEAAVLEIVNKYDENLKHNLMSIAEARELRGIEKGMVQGLEKGMAEGMEKVARFMLQAQEPINKIMSYTGLTREAIEKLQAEG